MGLRDAFIYDIVFCWFVNRNIARNNDMCYCCFLYPLYSCLNLRCSIHLYYAKNY